MRICRVHAPEKIERAADWPFDEGDQGPAEEAGSPASCPESYALKKIEVIFHRPLDEEMTDQEEDLRTERKWLKATGSWVEKQNVRTFPRARMAPSKDRRRTKTSARCRQAM